MFLLLGYGFSNQQVYDFLKRKKKKIIIYDDNLKGKKFIKNINFSLIKTIVVSAGIKPNHPILLESQKYNQHKIEILTDLDIFYKYKNKKDILIGITGSNGKTTTINIIHEILNNFKIKNWACGNIGISIFTPLKNFYKKPLIYIIEISSYQCHYLQNINFDISGIINITPNHDDWHGGFENYKKAKEKLLTHSLKNINFSQTIDNKWFINENSIFFGYEKMFEINNFELLFIQNQKNLLFSFRVIEELFKILKVNLITNENKKILEKINNFKLPPFRQEIIYDNKNLIVVNDSKSTNINSSLMAIENFLQLRKSILLIMGGIIKGNLDLINKDIINKINYIYIFGASRFILEKHFKDNFYYNYKIFEKMSDLINFLEDNIRYEVILFTPGGASYDEFSDYIERGRKFNKMFQKYIEKIPTK
jgi:UDP-N-acetylmuramoylalanine--D-glutamate ligase